MKLTIVIDPANDVPIVPFLQAVCAGMGVAKADVRFQLDDIEAGPVKGFGGALPETDPDEGSQLYCMRCVTKTFHRDARCEVCGFKQWTLAAADR